MSTDWDIETDIVVVGSGMAAFAAAVTAVSKGASVVMLERDSEPGGTTKASSGEYWIPNNSFMQAEGLEDPKPDCLRYMAKLAYPHFYDPDSPNLGLPRPQYELLETYYDRGSEAVDHLQSIGAVETRFSPDVLPGKYGKPEYNAGDPDNRAPLGRHLLSQGGTHTSGQGEYLIAGYLAYAEANGIELKLSHRVDYLFRDEDGRVTGVGATYKGTPVAVGARKGVIFGSGGFLRDPELAARHLPGKVYGALSVETNTGDFLRLATAAGAATANLRHAWWGEVPIQWVIDDPRPTSMNYFPWGDSMLHVNRFGHRVVNEKTIYHERAQVHFAWNPTKKEYSNKLLFQIYDDVLANLPEHDHFEKIRKPTPAPGTSANWVISGQTWEELAENVQAELVRLHELTGDFRLADDFAAAMKSTVARYNEFARNGVDHDFGRGEQNIERHYSPALREGFPNPTMAPLSEEGPYHCIILGPAAFDTCGGPVINTRSQVVDADGAAIPGLYAAGNCTASVAGQAYWSGGTTLGSAMVFGYIAGTELADG
ncbi:MAG: Fumarate reductase/succinate dehydrogenase flavoprotein domain protein [Actinomycetia bacterium]|nr:Fumarate reductase/succinate dehydrogenase flavoprotein domain protein [Actinomycetes bacterium]